MPCSDGGPSREQMLEDDRREAKIRREIALTRSVLCGICTVLEASRELTSRDRVTTLPEVLDKVDWEEAGVKRTEFAVWWDQHKEEDRQRRIKEQTAKREAEATMAAREKALAKLTLADRKALGLQ